MGVGGMGVGGDGLSHPQQRGSRSPSKVSESDVNKPGYSDVISGHTSY